MKKKKFVDEFIDLKVYKNSRNNQRTLMLPKFVPKEVKIVRVKLKRLRKLR